MLALLSKYLIIARFDEGMEWVPQIPESWTPILFNKGPDRDDEMQLVNVGREANTYLHSIVEAYGWMHPEDEFVFVQGNPFTHDPKFIEHLGNPDLRHYGPIYSCPSTGMDHMPDADLDAYSRLLGLPVQQEYRFVSGAQFRVMGAQILARPLEFWEALLAITKLPNKSAWSLERLWAVIFNLNLE